MSRVLALAKLVLAAICILSTAIMLVLSMSFYRLGSIVADPSTGRTYPENLHGTTVYVTQLLGEAQQILFFVGFCTFWPLLGLELWRRTRDKSN